MMSGKWKIGIVAFIVSWIALPALAQFEVDLEGGFVVPGYNDVRAPNETGTLFSLTEDLDSESTIAGRLRLRYTLFDQHTFSVLVAPLRILSDGTFDEPTQFEGATFEPGTVVDALYRFNSYRFTYRYTFVRNPTWVLGAGLTAKIRDAAIRLQDDNQEAENTDLGLVPLVNFNAEWTFADPFSLLLRGDALVGTRGRAEDVLLAVQARLNPRAAFRAGYRILEGGADVDQVYNFTLVNYAVFGVTVEI